MTRFDGVGLVDKPKLIKILQAIDEENLPAMYNAMWNTDESLRRSFIKFLGLNPVTGGQLALTRLCTVSDPLAAVRAAALCLLATKVAGN